MKNNKVLTQLMLGTAMTLAPFVGGAHAQGAATEAKGGSDIIVTARRTEERLQDVPISITVFNQQQLDDRNVSVPTDLAKYTPSLTVNERYGPEKSSFAIRGFNQDQATAPTVGVYFADVVGVRAQGGTTSGNTVGAGAFTDLQNVQVLKGPQGTLFGRNTTGGAVLLVPQKPKSEFGGFVEGSVGNFDMKRIQGAINIPISDAFRIRLSADHNEREGYMENKSGIGPKDYNDLNYTYLRFSAVADLASNLENYFIASYSDSDTNGYAAKIQQCNPNQSPTAPRFDPATTGVPINGVNAQGITNRASASTSYATAIAACEQIARAKARGDDEWSVDVGVTDPYLKLKQWQAINTTTWDINDNLTLKNIVSYGEFEEHTSFSLNSDNFTVPVNAVTAAFVTSGWRPGAKFQYINLDTAPGKGNSAQSTFTEEIQLQGTSFEDKLNWVAGAYYEKSDPTGDSAGRTSIFGDCADPENLVCTYPPPLGTGIISASSTRLEFTNSGIFAQGTYKLTDQFSFTGGVRYTSDEITGSSISTRTITFSPASIGGLGFLASLPVGTPVGGAPLTVADIASARGTLALLRGPTTTLPGLGTVGTQLLGCNDARANAAPTDPSQCLVRNSVESNKVTYMVDVDYKPTDDLLFYAKYAKGYRQGGLNFTNPTIETWQPESLDAYEIGSKVSLRGAISGFINGAIFYNDFTNQQVFGSLIAKPESGLSGGAAIINAGKSEIYGAELDASLNLTDNLRLDVGYAYTHSEVQELKTPVLAANSPFAKIIPNGLVGGPLILTPENKLTLTGTYTLPLEESIGKVSLAATWLYTDEQYLSFSAPVSVVPFYLAPATNVLNLNANWNNVMGSKVSVAAFGTNVTDEVILTGVGQAWNSAGFENALYAAPAMYGVRVKYDF